MDNETMGCGEYVYHIFLIFLAFQLTLQCYVCVGENHFPCLYKSAANWNDLSISDRIKVKIK